MTFTMYRSNTHSVKNRIVSISQPYIRPIVRGKAKSPTEFGAKLDMSIDETGFARLERLSFDPYNEGDVLIGAIENYRQRTGHYPERVLVDQIYRNRSMCAVRCFAPHDVKICLTFAAAIELTAEKKESEFPVLHSGARGSSPKKRSCSRTSTTPTESRWKEDSVLQSDATEWD